MALTQEQLEDLATRYTEAWNSKVPEAVAAFHLPTSTNVIKDGEPSVGHAGITAMAAGFHADVPDLHLVCEGMRGAGSRALYLWRFTGHHAETGNPLDVQGWEEMKLDEDGMVTSSVGWFDSEDYARQVG